MGPIALDPLPRHPWAQGLRVDLRRVMNERRRRRAFSRSRGVPTRSRRGGVARRADRADPGAVTPCPGLPACRQPELARRRRPARGRGEDGGAVEDLDDDAGPQRTPTGADNDERDLEATVRSDKGERGQAWRRPDAVAGPRPDTVPGVPGGNDRLDDGGVAPGRRSLARRHPERSGRVRLAARSGKPGATLDDRQRDARPQRRVSGPDDPGRHVQVAVKRCERECGDARDGTDAVAPRRCHTIPAIALDRDA